MQTEIWAHQGASNMYIGNTLAAFAQAIKEGADGIELDVQRTADGKLVVIHDENLEKLTGVNKFIWEITWSELKKLTLLNNGRKIDTNDAFHTKIPLLEEVLQLVKNNRIVINIELKNSLYFYPKIEEEIIDCVQKFSMQKQVLYSSFNHVSIKRMASLVGSQYCGLLTSDIHFAPWTYLTEVGVSAYHPMINSLQQPNLVKNCQKAGLKIHTWTVDKEAHIYLALLSGVDALITNKPAQAINLRTQFQNDDGRKATESVKSLGLSISQ